MAGPKSFLRLVGGQVTRVFGTVVSAGAANAGDVVALTDAGVLDLSLFPAGIGPDLTDGNATGTLAAQSFGYVKPDGTITAASAAAGSAHAADGFIATGVSTGQAARIFHNPQKIAGFTGLTPDAPVFLSETPGALTQTAVSGTGNKLHQYLGWAISATTIIFDPDPQGILLP